MKKLSLPIFLVLLTSLSACKVLDLTQKQSKDFQFDLLRNQLVIDTNATLITADNEKPLLLKNKAMTNNETAKTESIAPGDMLPIRVEYDLSETDLTLVRIEANTPITLELPPFAFDLMEPLKEHTITNLDLDMQPIFYAERTLYPKDQNVLTTAYPLLFVSSTQSGQNYDIQIALKEKLDYFHLTETKKSEYQKKKPSSVCDEENSEYYFMKDGFTLKIEQQLLVNFYEPGTSTPIATILPNTLINSIPSSLKQQICEGATKSSGANLEI